MNNEDLIKLIRAGGNKKENMLKLWNQNYKLVKQICKKYVPGSMNIDSKKDKMDELIQQAYIAFNDAVETFNLEKGYKFTTWICAIVPRNLCRYLTENDHAIRLPANVARDIAKYKKAVDYFEKENGRNPSDQEVSKLLNIDLNRVYELKTISMQSFVKSIDEPLAGVGDETLTIADMIEDTVNKIEAINRKKDHEIMAANLDQAVSNLTEQEENSIRKLYFEGLTYSEASEVLDVPKKSIVASRSRSLNKLRHSRNTYLLKEYYDVYLAPAPVFHVSVSKFNRTHTSSTEHQALYDIEHN